MAGLLYAPMNSPLLQVLRKAIRKEDISPIVPDWCKEGIEWDSHCTLYYGLENQDGTQAGGRDLIKIVDFLHCFLADNAELVFVPHQCEVFENPNWDCLVVTASNLGLNALHAAFQKRFNYKGSEYKYNPHIALGYVKKGLGKEYAHKFNTSYAGHKVMRVDSIVIEFDDGYKHTISV